jgi:hypothetical protein
MLPKSSVLDTERRVFPNVSATASLLTLERFSGIEVLLKMALSNS